MELTNTLKFIFLGCAFRGQAQIYFDTMEVLISRFLPESSIVLRVSVIVLQINVSLSSLITCSFGRSHIHVLTVSANNPVPSGEKQKLTGKL